MWVLCKLKASQTRRSIDMYLPSADMIHLILFETHDVLSKVKKWNVNGTKSGGLLPTSAG
jgi:hypothetical protein